MLFTGLGRLGAALILISSLILTTKATAQHGVDDGQWPYSGGDPGATKYSPLDQINAGNVGDLQIAWRWSSPDNEIEKANRRVRQTRLQTTPIMTGGVLYTSTGFALAAAIDPATGETLWVFDTESYKAGRPTNMGFVHRGVAHMSRAEGDRIFIATHDAHLWAIDAATGRPIETFGEGGKVDVVATLRRPINRRSYAISAPPIVCRGVVILGSSIADGATQRLAPPGDIQAFDAETGEHRWTFHSVPQDGEFGADTWEDESWRYTGNTNVWSWMSQDEELGYVYLPFGTPTNDWYGGHRKGDNLFGESLVCLNAETGERVWHFQAVHHGLWDYDLPTPPVLADITVEGREIKALAQVSKQGFTYVLDRTTGEPVWPIEERSVPQSDAPGERTSPTQPFPTKPAPFEPQGITEDDLIDYTPELLAEAKEILKDYNYGPLFMPPAVGRATIQAPGWAGGANLMGAALDVETGVLYIPSFRVISASKLNAPDAARSDFNFVSRTQTNVEGPQGLPLVKGPYSTVTAIDLNTGEHAWRIPLGEGPINHPALEGLDLGPLGSGSRGAPLVTKTLLFISQEKMLYPGGREEPRLGRGDGMNKIWALDKATGETIHEIELPLPPGGRPMTYEFGGKQYIAIAVGGDGQPAEIIALALP